MISVNVHSIQSAIKISVAWGFWGFLLEAKTSFFPSGVNMGKLSKTLLYVILSRPVPSMLMK
jgi:hypothetical protein